MTTSAQRPTDDPPRLVAGDRLTRDEFERRYHAMPESTKAELVDGVVYMPSPARLGPHARPHGHIATWLGHYEAATPGVEFGVEPTVRLDLDNEPQPDAILRIRPDRGGASRTSTDKYVEGAPELVVEVTASTASYDLHDKLRAYRRNGVLEYVVWRVMDGELDWFVLEGGEFVRAAEGAKGVIRSRTFPGLWLDVPALLTPDLRTVLETVAAGIRTAGHTAFCERLAES